MKWFPDWFNDIGFLITFLGSAIAIWQILLIKSRQKEIQTATNKVIEKINSQDNLESLISCRDEVDLVKSWVIDKDYGNIDKKIHVIRSVLLACKKMSVDNESHAERLLQEVTTSQENLNKVRLNPGNKFDQAVFLRTLDEVRQLCNEVIQLRKYEK